MRNSLHARSRFSTKPHRGLISVFSGVAAGQVIAMAASPVLARIYSPRDMGTFAVLTAFAAPLGTIAAGKYDAAIPMASQEEEARALAGVGLALAALSAFALSIVLMAWSQPIATAFGNTDLAPWLWVAPWLGAFMAASVVLNQLAIRHGRYGAIGRRTLLQWSTATVAQIALGFGGMRAGGLALGLSLGHLSAAAGLAKGSGLWSLRKTARIATFAQVMRRFYKFPLVLVPSGAINALGIQAPLLLIAHLYGNEASGWFAMTQRVLTLPVTLVGATVAQVFLSEFARRVRNGSPDTLKLFNSTSLRLALISVPGALGVALFSPVVFSIVLGHEWRMSGLMGQAMAISLVAQLIAYPVGHVLVVLEKTTLQFASDFGRLAVTSIAIAATHGMGGDVRAAVWALAFALAASYGFAWLLARRSLTSAEERLR